MKLLFGYKHVVGIPSCPCGDPGNYMKAEQDDNNPLVIKFTCWCGRTLMAQMDDKKELDEFLVKNGVV